MSQQDLIKIHHVGEWNQQIAPHEDLVGMLQLVRDARKVTIITKETGRPPELIEMLLFPKTDLDGTHIFGLQLSGDEIKVYRLTAPTVDTDAETPITQPREVGPGILITETKYPADLDPKEWSRQYHAELDRTVVRQTEDAVILEHDLQGADPETPVNFSIEPTIRSEDIQYHRVGSGALTITLLRNEMMYRVKQEQVRSDGSQDNHDFYIPAIKAVKDLPAEAGDVPAVKMRYDDGSQLPTEISLTEPIKRAILDAINDVDIELEEDVTDPHNELLKVKLTLKHLNPDNTEASSEKSASVHLKALITQWGEIEGDLADQTDLAAALDSKANIVENFTKPDGAVIDLDMPNVPPLIDEKTSIHDSNTAAHPSLLQSIADTNQKITDDIAAHNNGETAHPFIQTKITADIAAHNGDTASHTPLRRDLQHEFETHLDAHNTAGNSHQNIQTVWNNRLEDHNQDVLEDQHPLIRSKIDALALAMLPDARSLPNGDYKIRVADGVVTLEAI